MKRIFDDERTMFLVADMYYNKKASKAEIVSALNLSSPTINKLLEAAEETGVVKIYVSSPIGRNYFEEEIRLEKKYGLREVIITDSVTSHDAQLDTCSLVASKYLQRVLRENDVVGLGMGLSISKMIALSKPEHHFSRLTIVPLVGGLSNVNYEIHNNYLCEQMAHIFGGSSMALYAHASVDRLQTKEELLKDNSIRNVLEMVSYMRVAIISIGSMDEGYTISKEQYFSDEKIKSDLASHNMCGEICLRCYDIHGDTSHFQYNENVVGVELEQLRNIPIVIGIASEAHRRDAILGAIAGGYINTLVTDINCARTL